MNRWRLRFAYRLLGLVLRLYPRSDVRALVDRLKAVLSGDIPPLSGDRGLTPPD